MLSRTCLLSPVLLLLANAQGTKPKEKVADYPVHSQMSGFEMGAEYLVHSVPTTRGVIDAKDYLVIEVAIFPPPHTSTTIHDGDFTLRINGKSVLVPQAPGMVGASVKYPDWETRPTLETSGGIGDGGVVLGRPPLAGRFPGDNPPGQTRLPPRQTGPEQTDPTTGEQRPPELPLDQQITLAAFPSGAINGPVSGCLFFAFKGKTKQIHSLELLYRENTLKLF